jgi:hypothetical protein
VSRIVIAVLLTAALGLVGSRGAAAEAPETIPLTDRLTWDGSTSTLLSTHARAPFTVDLSRQAGVLPHVLHVSSGAGFVGFALVGQGANADALALAVRLPEPDDRGSAIAIGYGRRDDGTPCTLCTFPAGTYQLLLLTGGELSDARATVEIRLLTGDSAVTPLPRVGGEADTDQRRRTSSRPDTPLILGVSGFSELLNTLHGTRGIMVDQRVVHVKGRTVPALLTWAEFCHGPSSDPACVEYESNVGDVRWTTSNVTLLDVGPDETIYSRVAYTSAGNIDYYVANHALFIGL